MEVKAGVNLRHGVAPGMALTNAKVSLYHVGGAEIGRWMLDEELAPWPVRQPPAFHLEQVGSARFRVSRTDEK